MQIHALLALFRDPANRRQLLSEAITQTHSDLAAIRRARDAHDHETVLQAVHRAKGTACFLGCDEATLKHFDALAGIVQETKETSPKPRATRTPPRQHQASDEDAAALRAAYARVETVLLELEITLKQWVQRY